MKGFKIKVFFLAACIAALSFEPLWAKEINFRKEIVLLYTGETHGALYPCHCPVEPDGGLTRRSTLIQHVKRDNPNTLVLDAGGFFAGGLMDEYSLNTELDRQRTEITVQAMGLMRYDAAAVSSDEFNFGREYLEGRLASGKFAFLTSNIADSGFKPYIIKDVSGVKIGVTAVTESQAQAKAGGLKVQDPRQSLASVVADLKQRGANIVVVLSRQGEADDASLVKSIPGIDVLISGYERKEGSPAKIGNTIIASSTWQGRRLGKLTLKLSGPRIADYKIENIRLSDKISGDPEIEKQVPVCFSDKDCLKPGFNAFCQDPASLKAACVFTVPEKLNLQVISTRASKFTDTDKVVGFFKAEIPGLAVNYLDYKDKKAQDLIKKFRINALPAYIMDKKLEQEKAFEKIKQYFTLEDDFYVARPQFTGVTFFMDRQKVPGKIDLFLSLYEQDAYPLLSSIKDFKPQIHFLAVENKGGFDAKNGRREVEDDLCAVCVKEYYPQVFWDYIICRAQNSDSLWWQDCLKDYDSEKIKACARSEEGRKLLKENIALGRQLEVMFGPTYLLDNQEIFSTKGSPSKDQLKKILKR